MFDSLQKVLRLDTIPLESLKAIHCDQANDNPGFAHHGFVVNHFVSSFLKQQHKVVLVGLSQSATYYRTIQHKLGNNINRLTESNRFSFVDGLSLLCEIVTDTALPDKVEQLLEKIERSLYCSTSPAPKTVLILDDLDVLYSAGWSTADIFRLLLQVLTKLRPLYDTIITSSDCYGADWPLERRSLANQLSHWADLILHVKPLSTGLSRDVHGQVSIQWKSDSGTKSVYHYKTADRELKLYTMGATPGFL